MKKPVITTTTATESSAPGSYSVTVSGAEAQNYDISYQPGTLTVTEAEVSDPVITLNGNELSISCSTARAIIYLMVIPQMRILLFIQSLYPWKLLVR